jgi:hypothetical protein
VLACLTTSTVYTHLHGDPLLTCVNLLSVAAYDVHRERSPRQAGQGSVGGISQVPLVFTQPQSFGKWAIFEGSGPRRVPTSFLGAVSSMRERGYLTDAVAGCMAPVLRWG